MIIQIAFWVVGILLLLVLLPLYVKVRLFFDVIKNVGAFSVSLFGLPIICVHIEFAKGQINILGKKRNRQISLDPSDQKTRFINKFIYMLFLNIIITRLVFMTDIGKQNDAFLPAVVGGGINILLSLFLSFAYSQKGVFRTTQSTNTTTVENKLNICMCAGIIVNLLMILISLVKTMSYIKEYKNARAG